MEYARTNEHYPLAKYYSQFVQQYTVAHNLSGETKTPPNLEGIQKEEFERLMARLERSADNKKVFIDVPDYEDALDKVRDMEDGGEVREVHSQVNPVQYAVSEVDEDVIVPFQAIRGVGRPSDTFYEEFRRNWIQQLTPEDWEKREHEARAKVCFAINIAKWKFWDRKKATEKAKVFLRKANTLRREIEEIGFTKPRALTRIREDIVAKPSFDSLKAVVKNGQMVLAQEKVFNPEVELTKQRIEQMYLVSFIRDLEDRVLAFKRKYRAGYAKMPEYNNLLKSISKYRTKLRVLLDNNPSLD